MSTFFPIDSKALSYFSLGFRTDWIPSFLDGLEPEDRKLFNDLSSSDGELLPLAVTAMHALDPEWRDKVSPLVQPAAADTPGAAEVSDGTHIPASTATEGVGEYSC